MKKTTANTKNITRTTIAMALITALIALCAQAAVFAEEDFLTATFQTGSANGIDYIAGGVGDDDREALNAIARAKYNVKLVFATQAGNYVADIPVEITDKSGKKLLEVTSSGPFFYVKLPQGSYTIKATCEGAAKTQTVKVVGTASQQVVFTWLILTQ